MTTEVVDQNRRSMEWTSTRTESVAAPAVNLPETIDDITVCICSYKRPELLRRLLTSISKQRTDGRFTFSCAVVDNDVAGSARPVVEDLRSMFPVSIQYEVESARSFSMVRNRALSLVNGNLLAFIDDDEVPGEDWLLQLWGTMCESRADAVLGPVRPYFESTPPSWIVRSRICERRSHSTGSVLHWSQTRTGNVLLRRAIVTDDGVQFDPAYATGGEDVDFFKRAAKAGRKFVWCEDAPAYELVPEARLSRRYHLKRAFLQGRVSLKYSTEHASTLELAGVAAKAVVASAFYTVALPVLFLMGDHLGMKYLIKDCHHVGRLLAIAGLREPTTRNF